MSLILAVEPDRRRGRQLTSLVRRFTTADVVVAQSGAAAISAMGTRVPDLILTPALLPTQDEAVISAWVRELGDAAAHVQTLAVPILAESEQGQRDAGGSILGKLLDRSESPGAGHGCDPSVFADQIKVYLERAAADRSTRAHASAATQVKHEAEPAPTPPAASTPPAPAVATSPAMDDGWDLDEISLDSLVLEPLFTESPAPEPDASEKSQAAAPVEQVRDCAAMQAWERELGVSPQPGAPPALWRVAEGVDAVSDAEPDTTDDWALFDPSQTHFDALVKRLDDIVAQHAHQR